MKPQIALMAAVVLLGVAAFCVFGFLATFESSNIPGLHLAFLIGYVVVGISCIGGVVALAAKALRG
jgi:hypothetical protein